MFSVCEQNPLCKPFPINESKLTIPHNSHQGVREALSIVLNKMDADYVFINICFSDDTSLLEVNHHHKPQLSRPESITYYFLGDILEDFRHILQSLMVYFYSKTLI